MATVKIKDILKEVKKKFLSVPALAVREGVDPRTLLRWHNAHRGPPRVLINKTPFYELKKVIRWEKQHKKKPAVRVKRLVRENA